MNLDLTTIINPHFYPLLFDKHRYLVMYGGAGSGKSHFAAQKLLLRIIKAGKEGYRHRFLALRKTGPAARKSIFTLFKRYITEWGLNAKVNKTDMAFEFANGSEIYCGGLDDPEKIKSIEGVTGMWLEEPNEFNSEDFEQVDLRLRGITPDYKQIILSFNPISRMIWLFKRFFEAIDEDAFLHHSTYLNNTFLDQEYRDKLENLKKKTLTFTWYTLKGYGVYSKDLFTITGRSSIHSPMLSLIFFTVSTLVTTTRTLLLSWAFMTVRYLSRNFFTRAALLIHSLSLSLIILSETRDASYTPTLPNPKRLKRSDVPGSGLSHVRRGANSVYDGILFVKQQDIYVTADSLNLIKEKQSYKWREDKFGEPMDEPIGLNDHLMSAERYAICDHLIKKNDVFFEAL